MFAFATWAVLLLSTGFVGLNKYDQPNSTTIESAAAIMKRY
jgi:hypothetical protein